MLGEIYFGAEYLMEVYLDSFIYLLIIYLH